MNMEETTININVYHIVKENDKFRVYTPKLVCKRRKFNTKNEALYYIDSINKNRLPVYEHDNNTGIVIDVILPRTVKILKS